MRTHHTLHTTGDYVMDDRYSHISISSADRLYLKTNQDNTQFVADIFQWSRIDPTMRIEASSQASRKFVSKIPERQKLNGLERWAFAATDFTAQVIDAVWPRDQIEFEDDAKVTFDYLLALQASRDAIAHDVALFQRDSTVPQHSFELHKDYPLLPYQQVALCNSDRCEGYALFMEQGTGKTPIVIAQICNDAARLKERRMYCAIVVCPKNVRLNWQKEFEKFSTVEGRVTILRGNEIHRTKQFIDAFTPNGKQRYTIVVLSYEAMVRSWKILRMIEWDLAVLDESHFIKSPATKRYKFAMKLRETAKKRMILTGTPVTNHVLDLYAQLEFLGKGWSGFNSWKNFKSFYGVFEATGAGYSRLISAQHLPLMKERLSRISFLIRKEQALPQLPEKMYDVVEIEMTPEQSEMYEQLRKTLMIQIKAQVAGGLNKQLIINNVLTKLLRLAQITSGHIVWDAQVDDDGNVLQRRTVEHLAVNPKIDELLSILKDKSPHEKTIVWVCWIADVEEISRRLSAASIKHVTYYGATSDVNREAAERDFNYDADTTVLIGNPATGGVGLNLLGHPLEHTKDECTTHCNHVIYFSQNWSSTARSQSEDRAHRLGTYTNVRVTDLCVPNTIDEEIRTRVLQKRINAYEATDLRQILNNILGEELDV